MPTSSMATLSATASLRPCFQIPIGGEHAIGLDQAQLETLCTAVSASLLRNEPVDIVVVLDESTSIKGYLKSFDGCEIPGLDPNIRASLQSTLQSLESISRQIEQAFRLLLSPNAAWLGFPDGFTASQLAQAMKHYVECDRDRRGLSKLPHLGLELYASTRGPSAKIHLDSQEQTSVGKFLAVDPTFDGLEPELALKKALPAVL